MGSFSDFVILNIGLVLFSHMRQFFVWWFAQCKMKDPDLHIIKGLKMKSHVKNRLGIFGGRLQGFSLLVVSISYTPVVFSRPYHCVGCTLMINLQHHSQTHTDAQTNPQKTGKLHTVTAFSIDRLESVVTTVSKTSVWTTKVRSHGSLM